MAGLNDNADLIDTPAFVTITLGNGAQIKGRAMQYSNPNRNHFGDAFTMVDREGVYTYIAWAAIAHLTVFPLGLEPRDDD